MKPRDICPENFDPSIAVLDIDQHTEVIITYSGDAILFQPRSSIFNTTVRIPIRVWNEIADFCFNFQKEDLTEDHNLRFFPKGNKFEVLIYDGVVVSNLDAKVRKIKKYPLTVSIGTFRKRDWIITIYMSQLKKIIKWYNTDIS